MKMYYWSNFYKRKNSTRIPASAGTEVTIYYKNPSSFHDPVIQVRGVPENANYWKLPGGNFTPNDTYYFTTDVIAINNQLFEFHLTMDPCATFATDIKAYVPYVVRANDTVNFDDTIIDDQNPPTMEVIDSGAITDITFKDSQDVTHYLFQPSLMRYVLTVVGKSGNTAYQLNNGLAKSYLLSGGDMTLLSIALNDGTFLSNLVNELTNPLQSMIGCKAMPVDFVDMDLNADYIYFGSQNSNISGSLIGKRIREVTVPLSMPPDMDDTTYITSSAYMTATIYLPFVGVCPLDADQMRGKDIDLKIAVDYYTGDIVYALADHNVGTVFQVFNGNCSSECPISGGNYSSLGLAGGVLTTIGGVASGNPIMAASGILGSTASLQVRTQVNGSFSSVVGAYPKTAVEVRCYRRKPAHAITDCANQNGLMIMTKKQLSTLSGYVQCRDANIEIAGSDRDKDEIDSILNSGIFIE